MVPAMDMFTKSSPALSQTSEGEDRGRKREREVGEDKRGTEKKHTEEKTEAAQADDLSV